MSTRRLRPRISTTQQPPGPPPSETATSTATSCETDSDYFDSTMHVPPRTSTRKPRIITPRVQRMSRSRVGSTALSRTLASTAYLANLLPTGTYLAFQLLTPIFTNNGSCDAVTSNLTLSLLLFLAISVFFTSFTDSFRSPDDGRLYYGLATPSGMWLFDYPDQEPDPDTDSDTDLARPNLRPYRLRLMDWFHALLSLLVFGAVALRDGNVVGCLYPNPTQWVRQILDIVPIGVGTVCGLLFIAFPTKRHGIGYPSTGDDL